MPRFLVIRGVEHTCYQQMVSDHRKCTFSSLIPFQVVFESVSSSEVSFGDSFVTAIDDVVMRHGPCPTAGNCDFENGACTWVNNDSNDLDWLVGYGSQDPAYSGPSVDHTFGDIAGVHVINRLLSLTLGQNVTALVFVVVRSTSTKFLSCCGATTRLFDLMEWKVDPRSFDAKHSWEKSFTLLLKSKIS